MRQHVAARVRAQSHLSSSVLGFGQNQPMRATASGMLPHTNAQGVNMEPTKRIAVAIAAMKGQIEGSGEDSLRSARPCVIVETICSRFFTTGMRSKFCGMGGDAAAHSSVPASQGLAPAKGPRRALDTML